MTLLQSLLHVRERVSVRLHAGGTALLHHGRTGESRRVRGEPTVLRYTSPPDHSEPGGEGSAEDEDGGDEEGAERKGSDEDEGDEDEGGEDEEGAVLSAASNDIERIA